jgi:hypothetical protein
VGTRRVAFGVGNVLVVSLTMTGGLWISVLDGANTWSLIRPGYESSVRSTQLIRRWGMTRESVPRQHIGDEEVLKGSRLG